ncbi:MAG TPA: hypothetical protein VFV93_08125 [Thermomicrobiales bacterium]|nr:hypothetical protein [Thermomicrobiales bacterium]
MTPTEPEPTDDGPEQPAGEQTTPEATETERKLTSDDFLVPGPTPESNAGMARWGLTWLAFSVILILLMLCVSFVCLTLANWTGFA